MRDETKIVYVIGVILFVGACALAAVIHNDFNRKPQPAVASEPVSEEVAQTSRQWSAPMQRWLEAGNRLAIDYVDENGWCAVAIQSPGVEGEEPTIQCIK